MQTRKLGSSDLNLSVIGLGTWAMGGGGWKYSWGPQGEKESLATISRAEETITAADWTLKDEDMKTIESLLERK